MDEDAFTYASLRKLERLENTQPRLQSLEGQFWVRLGEHVAKVRQAFHDQQEEDPTNRRTVVLADELRNTYRLAESIWSLREKKIVQAALAASRRSEGRVEPPEHTTVEERHLWEETLGKLTEVRREVLRTAMPRQGQAVTPTSYQQASDAAAASGATQTARRGVPASTPGPESAPSIVDKPTPATASAVGPTVMAGTSPKETAVGQSSASSGRTGGRSEVAPAPESAEEAQAHEGGAGMGGDGEQEVELRLVWALKDVPMFTGLDLVDYELRTGEVGNVPANAAKILEARGLVKVLPDEEIPQSVA